MIDFKGVYTRSLLVSKFLNAPAKVILLLLATATAAFASTPTLDRISCISKTYSTAGTDTCRAFLTGTTATHLYITLRSSNPAVTVPSSITVSLNASSKGFAATIGSVSTPQTAVITATLAGISKSFTVSLSPTAASTGRLSINATSIAFGSDSLNTTIAQSVLLSSTGTAAVTVNSAKVSGTGFSMAATAFPVTLNPGQSLSLQVQFDPTAAGSYTGQLAISSSVSTQSIPLTGTGVPHQVELGWNAPSSGSVAGYNIYRAPAGSSSYARLNASLDGQTIYTDTTVQSGASYVYTVRSVSSTGAESSASNATTVKIP